LRREQETAILDELNSLRVVDPVVPGSSGPA